MRKQWSKAYGKVAYVTALSLILGSGAYFGIGAGNSSGNVKVAEAVAAQPARPTSAPAAAITEFVGYMGTGDAPDIDHGAGEWRDLPGGVLKLPYWEAGRSQDFHLYEGYTTTISFEHVPATDGTLDASGEYNRLPYETWRSFECHLVNGGELLSMRADNFNSNAAKIEITPAAINTSSLEAVQPAYEGEITITVTKTGERTVEGKVVYANGLISKYTITHTDAVDLENYRIFLRGNGCQMTFRDVKYVKNSASSSSSSSATVTTAPSASQSPAASAAASQSPAASAAASQSPAASGSPAASDAPTVSEAPTGSEAPAVSDAPAESQAPAESEAPAESQKPSTGDDDNNGNNNGDNNTPSEPEKQTNVTAEKQNGITVKADTKANGTATISTVKKTNKATVTIGSTITVDGVKYKVTTIGANAFKDCAKATKVSLPSTVTTISKNAFAGAKKLKTIKLTGKKAVTVKKGAFKGLNTKKMTVTVSKKMSKKEFNKMKKNLKKAGFKGKVKKA